MSEKLYMKCPICKGEGTSHDREEHHTEMAMYPPFCVVCDGVGFMEVGLHEGQVNTMGEKIRAVEDIYYLLKDSPWMHVLAKHLGEILGKK